MKRPVGFHSTAVAVLVAATIAVAAEPAKRHRAATPASRGRYVGEHEMTGTVVDVDRDDGKLTLDAEGHELALHFPPSALRDVNKGDRVTVRLSLRNDRTGAGTSMREPAAPAGTSTRGGTTADPTRTQKSGPGTGEGGPATPPPGPGTPGGAGAATDGTH